MKNYIDILKKCGLFSGIEEEDLLRMLNCLGAQTVKFDKKYTIFAEGSTARHIGIMLKGSAQVVLNDYYGNRSIVETVSEGEIFGEAFACGEVKSLPVSVVATEPSEVMFIECSHILHTCVNSCAFHGRLIFNLMKGLATKNLAFHQKVEITSKRTTRDKLMTYLMIQAKKAGKNIFDIPFDRQELADYIGVDRSGLSVEIGKLVREGVITSDKKHFELI